MNNSKKALQQAFRDAAFDPRKPGSLTTIVSGNDPNYLIARAEEILRDVRAYSPTVQRTKVRDAVAVLAYAMTLLPSSKPQHELGADPLNQGR